MIERATTNVRRAERPRRTPKHADGTPAKAVIQRKIEVGSVDSPFEREADRVAQQVMRKLDTSGDADPMSRMSDAFGADFGNVRLHTDRSAAQMSQSLQARAFTHGSDIYFGAGQFKPDTRDGQELLAHELTHAVQQGAAPAKTGDNLAQRSPLPSVSRDTGGEVRRWALDQGVDLTQIVALRTAGTAQQTFIAKDSSGGEIVIKPGSVKMNLLRLADTVNMSIHDHSYVQSHEVDGAQKAILAGKISNPAVSSHASWTDSGKVTPGEKQEGEDDAGKARRVFADMVATTTSPLTAMRIVDGKNAKQLAKEKGQGANKGGSAMRDRLESPLFMRSMGSSVVADAFTGNADRVSGGNLGNFMSTDRDNFTMIDNMDMFGGRASFKADQPEGWIPDELLDIGRDPRQAAENSLNTLIRGLGFEGEDKTSLKTWLEEKGTNRKQFMVDDMVTGMTATRDRIIKTYVTDKMNKSGRQLKNSVQGIEVDDNQVDFWEILKARAVALQDPGKAKKMKDRLQKRNAKIKKKARKK